MKDNGFTLVEVVISILLIGIIFVAIAPMFYQGLRTVFSFTSKTDAVNDARSALIDEIKGVGSTTPSTPIVKFIVIDIDTSTEPPTETETEIESITSNAYSITRKFSLPGKGEENVELNYYTYISP